MYSSCVYNSLIDRLVFFQSERFVWSGNIFISNPKGSAAKRPPVVGLAIECSTLPYDRNIQSEFRVERPGTCVTFYGEGTQDPNTIVEEWHPTESKDGWKARFHVVIETETLLKLKYKVNRFIVQAAARVTPSTYIVSNTQDFSFSKMEWDVEKSR